MAARAKSKSSSGDRRRRRRLVLIVAEVVVVVEAGHSLRLFTAERGHVASMLLPSPVAALLQC